MLQRVPITVVRDLTQLESRARTVDGPLVVIFDADNTIVCQGIAPEQFANEVNETIDRFEALPAVERVIVISNGPPRGVDRMISRGNKPWTTRRRLALADWDAGIWMVGDQVLTDGLLGWRLQADFFHLAIAQTGEQPRQAIMRSLGRALARLFFRPVDSV